MFHSDDDIDLGVEILVWAHIHRYTNILKGMFIGTTDITLCEIIK